MGNEKVERRGLMCRMPTVRCAQDLICTINYSLELRLKLKCDKKVTPNPDNSRVTEH